MLNLNKSSEYYAFYLTAYDYEVHLLNAELNFKVLRQEVKNLPES